VKRQLLICLCAAGVLTAGAVADEIVFPTIAHAAFNNIPFGNPNGVMHEVFDRAVFSNLGNGQPVRIEAIAFAPNTTPGVRWVSPLTIRLGLTDRIPGVGSGSGGLSVPAPGGGGAPNALGDMTIFYDNADFSYTVISGGPDNFEMIVTGTAFLYDPSQHNLLVEIVSNGTANSLAVSRAGASTEASRSCTGTTYNGEFATNATRMQFTYTIGGSPVCHGDCDCDGAITFADINPFVAVLAGGRPCSFENCDINGDGVIDFADINPFVALLSSGAHCP
jgi:hypothetical protein